MKYSVCLEYTGRVEKHVDVDADSYEEAVAKAATQDNTTHTVTVQLHPAWVGEKAKVEATEEYEHRVEGVCGECGQGIVAREVPGQPWNYGTRSAHGPIVCFKCLQKTPKEGV